MKIGLNGLFLSKPFTGIGQYSKNLTLALSQVDFKNEYLIVVPEKIDFSLPKNFQIIILPEIHFGPAGFRKTWWEQIIVPGYFQKAKVDLIHYFYPANPFLKQKIPTIVTVHDTIPWEYKAYRKGILSWLYHLNSLHDLKKADFIITVSATVQKKLLNLTNISRQKIKTVYNAASPFYHEKSKDFANNEVLKKFNLKTPFFLYVGGYDQRKNVPNLISAFQKFIAPNNAVDLILVGGKAGNSELYSSYDYPIKNVNSFRGQIIKTGFISEMELATLYKSALAFVNLSLEEGFNIPIIEAAVCGCALLISNIAVHREIAAENALYCDPNDLQLVAKLMRELIENQELRTEYQTKSSQLALKYSWKKAAKEILSIYEQLRLN